MDWWQDVLDRTSWLELVAAFVSVVASVVIALKIQDRDFTKRTLEAVAAENVRRADVDDERRRALVERALDLCEAFVPYLTESNHEAARQSGVRLAYRLYAITSLLSLEPDAGAEKFAKELSGSFNMNVLLDGTDFRKDSVADVVVGLQFVVEWYKGTSFEDYAVWKRAHAVRMY